MPRLRVVSKPEPVEPESDAPLIDEYRKRIQVPKHIRSICREYFNFKLEDFHVEALEQMFRGGYLVINWPTDHAKSTMGCFLFPILSLMDDPNETHIICGANINDSKRRVQAIELELETNHALVRDFPWIAKPQGRSRIWTATQFNVAGKSINKPNPSVLASAVGSNDLKGRRGKLMMDDIEGEDARWSPVKREQMYSWLKLEAWRCYEDQRETKRPLLCLLGTPFDVDSIYFRVEQQGWQVMRRSCYVGDPWTTNVVGQPWYHPTYLWPAKKEKVERAHRALRKLEFSVAYLMDPTGGDESRVSAAELQKRMSEAPVVEEAKSSGFISLDPASGSKGPKADYAGLVVVKIRWPQGDELPFVEIQEAYNFTGGLFEQIHFCAQLHEDYGYPVIYEGNSQQGGAYLSGFQHLHPKVPLLRHYTSHSNKIDIRTGMGLTVIKRLAVDRRLFVKKEQIESEGVQQLVQEIRDLQPPFKSHDHISAAIWFAVRHCYERVRHWNGPQINSGYGGRGVAPIGTVDAWRNPGLQAKVTAAHTRVRPYVAYAGSYEEVAERERQKEVDRFVNRRGR